MPRGHQGDTKSDDLYEILSEEREKIGNHFDFHKAPERLGKTLVRLVWLAGNSLPHQGVVVERLSMGVPPLKWGQALFPLRFNRTSQASFVPFG